MKDIKNKEFKSVLYNRIISFRKMLVYLICILIPIVFILYVLNVHNYIFPRALDGSVIFRLDKLYRYLMIILMLIYGYDLYYTKDKPSKGEWFMLLFLVITIISSIFSYNQNVALFGYPYRYEGMFTLLFYGFLYLNCNRLNDNNFNKKIIKLILKLSFVQLLFVILQLTGLYQKIIYMYKTGATIGLTENSNFLGSMMCMLSTLSLGYYLFKIEKKNYVSLIIFIISYITLLLTNTSGPFLSFVGTIVLIGIYLLIRKREVWQRFIIILIVIIGLYPVILNNNDEITPEIKSNINYVINLFKSNRDDKNETEISNVNQLGHGRIRIWKNTFKSIKKSPIIGYGPDNLGLVYEKSKDDSMIADKAHNIYLNIWVSSGIFALISYLLLIIYNLYLAFKNDNSYIILLAFTIISYSIQGMFNINVLEVTPYFYIIMGLMVNFIANDNNIVKKHKRA